MSDEQSSLAPLPETQDALETLFDYGEEHPATDLEELGEAVQEVAPEVVGLSVTLTADDLTFTLVADEVDEPVAAGQAARPEPRRSADGDVLDDVLDEQSWHDLALESAAPGVATTLSVPVVEDGQVVAAVDVYASEVDAFEGRHEEVAEAVGAAAAAAVTTADLEFSTRDEAVQAPSRLLDRDDIDVAVGLIAIAQGVDVDTARQRLRTAAEQAGFTEAQAARAVRAIRPG